MSEEQFKIWKQVEAKGLEKLEKVEKALASTEKEGFEEAHKRDKGGYCIYAGRLQRLRRRLVYPGNKSKTRRKKRKLTYRDKWK